VKLPGFTVFSQTYRKGSHPRSGLQKQRKQLLKLVVRGHLDKVRYAPADQVLKRNTQELRQTAIGNSYFSIESQSEDCVIEIIDEIAVVVLRVGNHFDKFVVLRFAGGSEDRSIVLLVGQLCRHSNSLVVFSGNLASKAWDLASLEFKGQERCEAKQNRSLCQVTQQVKSVVQG
jgi:hypothetical protein